MLHEFMRENGDPEASLKRFGNLTDFGDDMLKISGASVQVVDGSTNNGAALTEISKINLVEGDPYGRFGENKWEDTGDVATSDRRAIILGNRHGWSILGLHSAGELSNTVLLEAYAEANKEKPLAGRHFGIDHGEMLRPSHIKTLKELDVIPSLYTFSVGSSETYTHLYGADAVYNMMPTKSLIAAGVMPVAESDSRPPRSNPLWVIKNFVTRKDKQGKIWNANEKISRREALYMYTLWSARYTGEQNKLGSIEPGKLADLAVLAGDYMTFPEDELDKLRVLLTLVGGKAVHEVPGSF
jgi:hypothetical protein